MSRPAASDAASSADTTLEDAPDDLPLSWRTVASRLATPAARRGLIALAAAVVALVWPRATTLVVAAVAGGGLVLVGLSDLVDAVRRRRGRNRVATAGAAVVAGAVVLAAAVVEVQVLSPAVGALLSAWGALAVALALHDPPASGRGWALVRGVGFVVLGVVVALAPVAVAVVAVALVAAGWVLTAVVVLAAAVRGVSLDVTNPERVIAAWLRGQDVGPSRRAEVVATLVVEGPETVRRVSRFVVLMLLATVIATLGVQTDSTAVVIGAMLVAPLMTPILATAASLLMGWPVRAVRSAGLVALGVGLAVGVSWLLARYAPSLVAIDGNSQVLGRTSPTLLDLLVAVAAGAAGAYAVSRSDVADSLPGVAVAVALVPPLSVVGVSLEAGAWAFAGGAFLLFLTNLVGVVLAAGVAFVLVGLAPWFRLTTQRDRLLRTLVTVGTGVLVVSVPLVVTGDELARAAADEETVEATVDEWLGDPTAFTVAEIALAGESVDVVVVGSGEAPVAERLARLLAERLDRTVVLDLRVIPEERTVVRVGP